MRRLSSVILLVVLCVSLSAQKSPHGAGFKTSCADCHKTAGWKVDLKTVSFDHKVTKFPLVGQHQAVNCKECHTSLEFAKAQTGCNDCHTDIHEQTVGNECARCHTPNSWVVTNITRLHQQSRFPLIGPHTTADCKECHKNLLSAPSSASPTASLLRFDPLGIECYDCHKDNYLATTSPNHVQGNYSTNCNECHKMNSFTWAGAGINHNFFPLTDGHAIDDCNRCHTSGSYSKIPSECISCHEPDYNSTTNPNHRALNFSANCNECHSLIPGWKPAEYADHDAGSFPIYSGSHKGEWNSCADCHTNPGNYSQFSCTDCHEHNKSDMDDEHGDVSGYTYNSNACFGCHPTGSKEKSIDHAATGFPLSNGHASVDCAKCHTNGYAGTSNVCANCHANNYNQSTNPNHSAAGISNDCATCHTTLPDWKPAAYPTHSNLQGVHIPIANECATCHKGNYTTLPKTCSDCHINDYTQSTNPSHTAAQFPTTCYDCHSQTAWVPSTFDHSTIYPLIGSHATIAKNCNQCHANGYLNTPNTCAGCHAEDYNQTTNPNHTTAQLPKTCETCHTPSAWVPSTFNHTSVYPLVGAHTTVVCESCHTSGYVNTPNTCAGCHTNDYNQTTNPNHTTAQLPKTCETCHTPSAWVPSTFNHTSVYPLVGAHTTVVCETCHTSGYVNTPNTCAGCHTNDYNQTTNPNHTTAQLPKTCETCHTPSAWVPSTFNHTSVYPLVGAHTTVACESCHTSGYVNTPNTCAGCHTNDYNQSTNPNHITAQLPKTCETCHTPSAWAPSTFNHTSVYPLVGAHTTVSCESCHTSGFVNTPNTCAGCHTNDYNQTTNPNHTTAQLPKTCETCHTPSAWVPSTFNHTSVYPLTGAHTTVACNLCHANGYSNTPNTCAGCHQANYNASTNPGHTTIGISTDCVTCHTTNPGWEPATFPTHNDYYVLAGAHIPQTCVTCHNGNYNSTPNTCAGCHITDYNQTTNPNHTSAQFPNTCADCHTQSTWKPANWNHDQQYFPIYSGKHQGVWNTCADCHKTAGNYAQFTCIDCHEHNQTEMNDKHKDVSSYSWTSSACYSCHPQGNN